MLISGLTALSQIPGATNESGINSSWYYPDGAHLVIEQAVVKNTECNMTFFVDQSWTEIRVSVIGLSAGNVSFEMIDQNGLQLGISGGAISSNQHYGMGLNPYANAMGGNITGIWALHVIMIDGAAEITIYKSFVDRFV
ncbi:MAG TPA: hypothetical protein VLH13_00835 [Methanomassiliicoccales archaeon]|nr:hypothetical protein [Methanomassiliicoccales archaeon]